MCATLDLVPNKPIFPVTITSQQCRDFAALIADDVSTYAASVGAAMVDTPPAVTCETTTVTVCGVFLSAAEAQKIQTWLESQVSVWLSIVAGDGSCPSYLYDYDIQVAVGGPNGQQGCVEAFASTACYPQSVPFPKCE